MGWPGKRAVAERIRLQICEESHFGDLFSFTIDASIASGLVSPALYIVVAGHIIKNLAERRSTAIIRARCRRSWCQ